MTTIACDGKSMAGDGQRNHLGTITSSTAEKIRRLSDGRIVGTSGDVSFGDSFVAWLDKGGDQPKYEGDAGFAALILQPNGELLIGGQDCKMSVIEKPYAIGSGMDLAIGAMDAGKSPLEAVIIASNRDPHTGGAIMMLETSFLQVVA
jgi:ATP-dependent protease HslVU (ClpYQ) peptidase subunit